jgi:lipopolysaccharide biosynthesis glycosyltransferase
MKICYIFDYSYVSQFLTVTNSILSNEKKIANSIEFYIAYFGEKETISKLIRLAELNFPNNKFHIKHIPSEFPQLQLKYNSKYDFENSSFHIQTSSVLCRFDLDEIWSEIDEKILYLDLDIIVKHSISELYSSLQGCSIFYACEHRKLSNEMKFIDFNEPVNSEHLLSFISIIKNGYDKHIEKTSINENILNKIITTNYDFDSPAFNAGVFVLDLRQYRQNKYFKDFANFLIHINRYENVFRYNDQSILNIIFYEHTNYIDSKWNATDYGWYNRKEAALIRERFDNSHIIHFCGPEKPWSPSFKDKPIPKIHLRRPEKSSRPLISKIFRLDESNNSLDIKKFFELNELDLNFDEVEYTKKYPETKGFYYECLDYGFSDKQRLYYHYCMYGNHPHFKEEKSTSNNKLDIKEFFELNELDLNFNEVEYAKKYPETKDFYHKCLDYGFSNKQRLYYHYCICGNCPSSDYVDYFAKGIELWKQYEIPFSN